MTVKLQLFNPPGSLYWDSSTAVGGIVADYVAVGAGSSGVWSYPAYAGRQCYACDAIGLVADVDNDIGVAVDAALGYPRVTAAARSYPRGFVIVMV